MSHGRRSSRRGLSLMELTVAIAITSLLMALAMTTLGNLMQAHEQRDAVLDAQMLARMVNGFREDVHAATSVSRPQGQILRLELLNGQSVAYQRVAKGLQRSASEGDRLRSRDVLLLPHTVQVRAEDSQAPIVSLLLAAAAAGESTPRPLCQIDAELGRDQRMTEATP